MADNVLKEFLVAIGFKADEAQLKRVDETLARVTKTVIAFEAAFAAAAVAVVAATTKMAGSFEDLYYASQRTRASVQNIQALGYAVSQLGGSYAGALGSLEAFGKNLRTNPGYESMVRQLGVATSQNGKLRDTVDILADLGKVFAKQRYEVAYQYATALGLDEQTFRALRDQPEALKKYREEYERTARSMGLNSDEAAKSSKELDQSLRSMWLTVTVAAQRILTDFTPAIKALVDKIRDWIATHPEEIERFITAIGDASKATAKWLVAPDGLVAALGKIERAISAIVEVGSKLIAFFKILNTEMPGIGAIVSGSGLPGTATGSAPTGSVVSRAWGATKRLFGVGGAAAAEDGPHAPGTTAAGTRPPLRNAPTVNVPIVPGSGTNADRIIAAGPDRQTDPANPVKGFANLMKGQYGPPGSNLTTITTNKGVTFKVHKEAAPSFLGFLNDLEGTGYNLTGGGFTGGYAPRNMRGSGKPSQHAYGNAIDINASRNPQNQSNRTDMPKNVSDLAAKWGVSWGGDWSINARDPMHFEWTGARPWENKKGPAPKAENKPKGMPFGLTGPALEEIEKRRAALSRTPVLAPESLVPSVSNDNSRSVSLQHKTEINVLGGGDPVATANEVASRQNRVNAMTLRNAQGAVQ